MACGEHLLTGLSRGRFQNCILLALIQHEYTGMVEPEPLVHQIDCALEQCINFLQCGRVSGDFCSYLELHNPAFEVFGVSLERCMGILLIFPAF